jgi:peroxiredoxin
VQLAGIVEELADLGINVATITYDPVDFLKEVQEDQDIQFPLLHDENVKHVNSLGIRNMDYEPGDRTYGIPYPGMLLVDSGGIIRYKFAEQRYQDRPALEIVLEAAARL